MRIWFLIILIIVPFATLYAQIDYNYFGQVPQNEPEIFAKGIVSSNNQEHSLLSVSQDGSEMWWSIWELPYTKGQVQKIFYIKKNKGEWTQAQLAPFSGEYKDGGPFLSFDGKKLFFYSRRPVNSDTIENDNDIWYVERMGNSWGEPINAGKVINTDFVEANPVLVKNNNLYFTSNRDKSPDIYLSKFVDGVYKQPIKLSDKINTSDAREMFFTVSPDESYIIFTRDNRIFSNGELISGERNLMISFKNNKGEWGEAILMESMFNDKKARFPSLSPDGKCLFFTRYTEGNDEDFYWVDAAILNSYK